MVQKHRLYWTLQVGGWLLYALIQIIASVLATGKVSTNKIIFLLYEALIFLAVTHLFRYYLSKLRWLYFSLPKLIPSILLSVGVLAVIVYFLRMPATFFLGIYNQRVAFDVKHFLGLTSIYSLIFFLWSVLYFTYHYFERYSTSLKYDASMIEIELNNLKSQLNPHFIFNALNSIRALVDENPLKSKQAINQLSNILRNSLASDKKGLTNFEDEFKTVRDYLGLESIRFEERLKVEFEIDPKSQQFLVPSLMIQTLVENGIKHGISKLTSGGIIQVKTFADDDRLKIQIRNSGHLVESKKPKGLGIKNTIQRLKLIYGDEASFTIENESDKFVLTEIIVPQNYKYESINRG
jgi:two-component system LytT family sensor kinase